MLYKVLSRFNLLDFGSTLTYTTLSCLFSDLFISFLWALFGMYTAHRDVYDTAVHTIESVFGLLWGLVYWTVFMKQYTSQEFLSKIFLTKYGLFHQGFFTIATCTNTSTRCTMNGKHPLASHRHTRTLWKTSWRPTLPVRLEPSLVRQLSL